MFSATQGVNNLTAAPRAFPPQQQTVTAPIPSAESPQRIRSFLEVIKPMRVSNERVFSSSNERLGDQKVVALSPSQSNGEIATQTPMKSSPSSMKTPLTF